MVPSFKIQSFGMSVFRRSSCSRTIETQFGVDVSPRKIASIPTTYLFNVMFVLLAP